jgi:tellurite resistance protein TerC
MNHLIDTWWLWVGFIVFLLLMILFDLFVLGANRAEKMLTKEALAWSLSWIVLALLFDGFLWWYVKLTQGPALANTVATNFLSGYFIEKSLALDNIFVFLLIFQHFKVPPGYQRRVLTYGVLGAIILRAVIIVLGSQLVREFSWILYLFGVFLLVTGLKMFWVKHSHADTPSIIEHPVTKFLSKHLRVTREFYGDKFFVRKDLLWYVTPLFIVVILIEFADVIFATDSIPAIFAITTDPFIVFSSNMFAVMGLRTLHFLLGSFLERFHGLHYGLALILTLIGVKLLAAPWYHVSATTSLIAIVAILVVSALASFMIKKDNHAVN